MHTRYITAEVDVDVQDLLDALTDEELEEMLRERVDVQDLLDALTDEELEEMLRERHVLSGMQIDLDRAAFEWNKGNKETFVELMKAFVSSQTGRILI